MKTLLNEILFGTIKSKSLCSLEAPLFCCVLRSLYWFAFFLSEFFGVLCLLSVPKGARLPGFGGSATWRRISHWCWGRKYLRQLFSLFLHFVLFYLFYDQHWDRTNFRFRYRPNVLLKVCKHHFNGHIVFAGYSQSISNWNTRTRNVPLPYFVLTCTSHSNQSFLSFPYSFF